MSIGLVKNTEFSGAFDELVSGNADGEIGELRRAGFDGFERLGIPTPRDEDWKYTNPAPIFIPKWNVAGEPSETPSAEALDLLRRFEYKRNGFTALNLAFACFRVITIPGETSVDMPISLDIEVQDGAMASPHFLVIAEPGSKATIVESYSADGRAFTNSAIQVMMGENSNLTHYRIQKDSAESFHYGVTEISLGRGSVYNSTNVTLGGAISRHDIDLKFTAEGGVAWVDGLYMLNGSQHADSHSIIDHTVPNCISHQTYKGVMNGRSRAVFNGKVFVRENAHGTDANQSNKNLLLSNEARVDTKPQLEIFNDDVKCSHGATVGQLEEEELFYLLTRGLPENLARNLLTYGFAEEIISKIGIDGIRSDLDAAVLNRLNVKLEV